MQLLSQTMDTTNIVNAIICLLSGLGILLIGFKLLSDNIEKLANTGLKKLFNKTSKNCWVGIGIGAAVTAIIQSSGASTIMIVGFVNAGLMDLFQATAMIMGANIGTTITAQIASLGSFDVALYATLFAFIGAFMNMFCKKDKAKTIGLALAGLGAVFLSLDLMKDSMKVFSDSEAFTNLLQSVNNPFLLLFIGIALTALLQSSSALTTILIAMVTAGLSIGKGPNDIIYVILGTNIGSCVTALLSSFGASINGKRASLIHLLFNTTGSLIFFIVLLLWPSFMEATFMKWFPGAPGTQIAMFHTFFNVICTLLFVPFIKYFVKIAEWLVKEKQSSSQTHLDKRFLLTPAVALDQSYKETFRIGKISIETLNVAVEAFLNKSDKDSAEIKEKISEIEVMNEQLMNYLVKVATAEHSKQGEKSISKLHEIISDFNREIEIADNMLKYTKTVIDNELSFSTVGNEQIRNLMEKLMKQYYLIEELFHTRNYSLITYIDEVEEEIDALRSRMIAEHIERIEQKVCSPANSGVYISLVSNLERAGDHLNYIAHSLVEEKM